MSPWVPLLGLSALAGMLAGAVLKGSRAVLVGAAIPWLGVLGWLLYNEYFVPYQGGGASMWPVAQFFAGSIAALVGAGAAAIMLRARHAG
jgi:hypothetical protein